MWYHVTTSFYLTCPSSAMAYSYVSSNDFSAQYPIAFSHGSINLPCTLTQGSPGDAIDNDCDGRVDEDDCSTSTPPGNVDCAPVISGDRDVYGKSFTFLVPPNGNGSEVMLLFASCSPEKDVLITVTTPLDLSLVNMTAKILAGENHTSLNVSNTGVIADGSRIFRDRTVHVAADSEISVTLVVLTSVPTASGLSVLVIPDDVLGQEYFIAAFTKNNASCTIQITAFHVNTTTVKIRLRLPDTTSSLEFEGQQYHAGQLICVDLEQYQSLQIQEPIDLSGTHITSNKPVSVWSGGILAYTHSPTNRDSFSEHLPPTVSWGMKYIVRLSDMSLVRNKNVAPCPTKGCEDFLKIVSSESNTAVNIVFNSSLNNNCTLGNPGDFLQILVLTELLVITADKPVLVVQILASYPNSETSASYVAPVEQYLTGDRIVFPNLTDVIVRQLLVTYSLDNSSGRVLLAGDANITMVDSTLHGAGSAVYNSSKNFQLLSGRPKFPFGGHVFFSGSRRTMLQPIAFAMKKTNQACEISTSQPGDGRDNDCDGTVDEEDCGPNNDPQGTDDDNDGMANEDCKVPPLTSSLPTDSPTASYSTPDLDYTASDGLTSATDQATEDLSTSFFQDLTTGVTSSVWPEMTSSHGTDSLISTDLESVTDTLDSGFPSSISHPETESQSTEQLGASSATPSSLSPSLMGLTPSSTESTSTTTISPSSSTLMSATAPTTAAATALSASASSTTTTKTATAVLSSHPCGCLCPSNVLTSRLQSSQIDSLRSSIQKNLEVDKSELSATTRKLISVNDQRPSAQTIGFFGVTLVVVAFSGIVLLDSGILIRNIMKLIQKCKKKT
ncbi:unnamed protein product [Lymnaea stagnalis]|uniref:IgGFc-binding protein N-terminal domain-containing protein n=1 Tax=Lymnaea stagnalis TaxID=6523 RepID=A0AAV2I812_LYMST